MATSGSNRSKSSSSRTAAQKKAQKTVKNFLKKVHIGYLIVMAIFLIIGIVGGTYLSMRLTAKDVFSLNGQKETVLSVGETLVYEDEGISCVRFGADQTKYVQVETNMQKNGNTYTGDTSEENEYYIIYHLTGGAFGGKTLYRTFRVVAPVGSAGN